MEEFIMGSRSLYKENFLRYFIWGLFVAYLIILFRITLFKQASLYNLFSAIGASERIISVVPFKSTFDMINTGVSISRIVENVMGNIGIFIPFGLLFPVIAKKAKNTLIYGVIFSFSIEFVQFTFGLGSSDVDDLIFNAVGVAIGYAICNVIKKKSGTNTSAAISIAVLISTFGSIAISILFVTNTELFMLFPKKTVVENKEIVQEFIDTTPYISGKFVEFDGRTLIIEKNIKSAKEQRTLVEIEVISDSKVYICYNAISYFFSTISKEHTSYKQLSYSDFISVANKMFSKEDNVLVWSSDSKTVDNLVIIEWVE